MIYKIKEIFNKLLDIAVLKEENKLLKKQVEELKIDQQPLIDLKNKYLSELRVKNLEIGKLNKKVGEYEKVINNNTSDNFNTKC